MYFTFDFKYFEVFIKTHTKYMFFWNIVFSGFFFVHFLFAITFFFLLCFVLHLYFDIKVLKSTQIRLKTFYPQLVYNIISFSVSKHTVLYTKIFFFLDFFFVYIVAARKALSFIWILKFVLLLWSMVYIIIQWTSFCILSVFVAGKFFYIPKMFIYVVKMKFGMKGVCKIKRTKNLYK